MIMILYITEYKLETFRYSTSGIAWKKLGNPPDFRRNGNSRMRVHYGEFYIMSEHYWRELIRLGSGQG